MMNFSKLKGKVQYMVFLFKLFKSWDSLEKKTMICQSIVKSRELKITVESSKSITNKNNKLFFLF